MDLFVIQRYGGEDSKAEADVPSDKTGHLQRLLSKIEEKKRIALQQEDRLKAKKIRTNVKSSTCNAKKEKNDVKKPVQDDKATEHLGEEKSAQSVKEKRKRKKDRSVGAFVNDIEGKFTVLGDDTLGSNRVKVEAQLPYWLANPSVVSVDLKNLSVSIEDLPELDKDLVEKLRQNKITHFFPVQHQVIPWLLEAQGKPPQFWPRDVCVSAPTGSGKTIAFVLPIVQALRYRLIPQIRALVVLPVQELATQVYEVFLDYCSITDLQVVCITGRESFQSEQSQLVRYSKADCKFYSCADIVVTTPGRLVDHLQSTAGFSLQYLKYLVLDEADRIMGNIQNDWLYHLYRYISPDDSRRVPPLTIRDISERHPPPQKLLFSATLNEDPELLQQLGLFQPKLFTSIIEGGDTTCTNDFVGKYTTPAELTEIWVGCEISMKPLYLYYLILEGKWKKILVFTNTVQGAHRLSILLKHLFGERRSIAEVSSALLPKQRKQIFEKFSSGDINVLVSSDALARGIDVPDINCVVCYDAPRNVNTYIHRVGRTARAGHEGTAITLVEDNKKSNFEGMLSKAFKKHSVKEKVVAPSLLDSFKEDYKQALTALRNDLEVERAVSKEKFARPKLKGKKFLNYRHKLRVFKSSSKTHERKRVTRMIKKVKR